MCIYKGESKKIPQTEKFKNSVIFQVVYTKIAEFVAEPYLPNCANFYLNCSNSCKVINF